MLPLTVTTSWDDGDRYVPRLADLLETHRLRGTFYVSRVCPEAGRMSEGEIRDVGARHEIGGHTLGHVRLDHVTTAQARTEIVGSRAWLADVLGREVTSFCYPWGKWTPRVVELTRDAGFTFGRTIEHLSFSTPVEPLLHGATAQTIPQAYYAPRLLRIGWNRPRLLASFASADRFMDELAALCSERGVPFHLWGHAWEVERLDQWDWLDRLFGRLAATYRVRAVTNSQLQ